VIAPRAAIMCSNFNIRDPIKQTNCQDAGDQRSAESAAAVRPARAMAPNSYRERKSLGCTCSFP
jgi:hypothetical protein